MGDPSSWAHSFGAFDLAVKPGGSKAREPLSQHGRGKAIDAGAFGVNVVGHLASEKGVGESVRAVARGLTAAGVPHILADFPDPGAANVDTTYRAAVRDLPYPVTILSANPDGLSHIARLYGPDTFRDRYVIGNWHWELADFPREWEPRFNLVDEVWVGSRFTLDAVSRSSPVPVVCVPPALAFEPPPHELTRSDLGILPGDFVFLYIFDLASTLDRKNPLGLIRAFRTAFPANTGVRLVLKFSRADRYPGKREMVEAAGRDGRVLLLDGVLPRGQVRDLMALCDCYASLHRAEGFGLTLAEAMAMAKPVVATGYSGNTDFATHWNSFPVKYRLVPIARKVGPYPAGAVWADPDEDDAARQMRWVYENRTAASEVARAGQANVAEMFDPAVIGKLMVHRLERIPVRNVPG